MKSGAVYYNDLLAGYLEKHGSEDYVFQYEDAYFLDPEARPISLTFPKNQQIYRSTKLFAFFSGLLSEGINKRIQCRLLKIDENDDFTRLIKTAGGDTIGAITIKEI